MDLNTTPVEKHLLALLEIAVVDNKGLLIWKERFLPERRSHFGLGSSCCWEKCPQF